MIVQYRCVKCKRLLVKVDVDMANKDVTVLHQEYGCNFKDGELNCTKCGVKQKMHKDELVAA